jgi:hypothetical protein
VQQRVPNAPTLAIVKQQAANTLDTQTADAPSSANGGQPQATPSQQVNPPPSAPAAPAAPTGLSVSVDGGNEKPASAAPPFGLKQSSFINVAPGARQPIVANNGTVLGYFLVQPPSRTNVSVSLWGTRALRGASLDSTATLQNNFDDGSVSVDITQLKTAPQTKRVGLLEFTVNVSDAGEPASVRVDVRSLVGLASAK